MYTRLERIFSSKELGPCIDMKGPRWPDFRKSRGLKNIGNRNIIAMKVHFWVDW